MTNKTTMKKKPAAKALKSSARVAKSTLPALKATAPKLTPWVPGEHIRTKKDAIRYIDGAFREYFEEFPDDEAFVTHSMGVAIKRIGMAEVAKKSGLSREALYRALSYEGNPEFATILKVCQALGIRLKAVKA